MEAPIVQHLDQSTESVLVTGTVPGASVIVYRNGVEIASAGAGPSSTSTRVALSQGLVPGDVVTATQSLGGVTSPPSAPVTVELNHVTHQFDRQRTGWNPYETSLNVPTMTSVLPVTFRLLFTQDVDGQVYAQSLYVQNVEFVVRKDPRTKKEVIEVHNVLYVATENGSVYAFDADNDVPPLNQRKLVPKGERVVGPDDIRGEHQKHDVWSDVVRGLGLGDPIDHPPCTNIAPYIGITATPVIDRTTDTLYVTAKTVTMDGTNFHWRLHALDLATLVDQQPPVEIQASVPGSGAGSAGGIVTFDPQWQLNRPALLLCKGVIYVAFGSHCDYWEDRYHGWLMAYDATNLRLLAAFNTSPDPDQEGKYKAGIWLSGCGPAADSDGHVYLATGDGTWGGRNYGNAVLKLKLDLVQGHPGPIERGLEVRSAGPPVYELSVVDYFVPSIYVCELRGKDKDVGSGGVMLLPPQPQPPIGPLSRQPPPPALLFACGKNAGIYILDPGNLGGYTLVDNGLLQKPPQTIGTEVFGGPAYFEGPNGHFVYYCGNHGPLRAFSLAGTAISPSTHSSDTFWGPDDAGGAIPTVSSNGSTAGSGVVWVVTRSEFMNLIAYDATDVSVKLFQGEAGSWDNLYNPGGSPFMVPTVIHGKVYVGTANQVAFFGLGEPGIVTSPTGVWATVMGLLNALGGWIQAVWGSIWRFIRPF